MDVRYFYQLSMVTVLIFYKHTDATWTLTGSSDFAVAGESFTLICDPQNSSAISVLWKRLAIDTSATGTNRATVNANECKIEPGYDAQYRYTCETGPVYKLTIPANVMTNSQNNKVWGCESFFGGAGAKYQVKVQVPVSSISIQADNAGNQQVNVIDENIPKTFYCITNGCRPKANVTVTTTGVTKGQLTESSTQHGDLIITRVSQVIRANREGSTAKTLQCSAVNIQGRQPVTSQLVTLDVYYKPIITLDTTDLIVQEGDNLSRPCSAIGNPTPTVKWYRGSNEQTSGTGTSSTLVFSNIDRNQADTYQCKATTGKIDFESKKSLSVVVYYPPAVTVTLKNTTENATNVVFTCNADGFPTNYTYHGWNQYIANTLVRSYPDFNGMLSDSNRKLTIPKVTVEDIGQYYCYVENGFHGRKSDVLQQGSSYFDVIVSANFASEEEARKPGELHKIFTTNIKFFSNPPALMNGIKWINKTSIRNPLTDSESTSMKLISTAIQRIVYGKVVTLTGQSAVLTIASLQSFHLGYYQLQIHNGENLSSSFDFQIITSAPPEAPSELSSAENGTKSVILTWKRGFNGGHAQTFVIRYTNTDTHETKDTTIKDTNKNSNYTIEIDGLEPSTTYHFWIYSTNEKGNSTLSDNLIVQTLKEPERENDKIGAITGGVTGILVAIIVFVVIGGVILYRRRTQRTKRNDCRQNGKFPFTARDRSDEQDGMRDNVLYEPSEPNTVKTGECGGAITRKFGSASAGIYGGATGGQNDYPYADVQKNGKNGLNNPISVHVEEQKIPKNDKKPDPSAMYADVQKPKQEENKGKVCATPKKLLGKSKEKKQKPATKAAKDGTLYENMDDFKAQEKDDQRKKPKGPKTKTKPNKVYLQQKLLVSLHMIKRMV